MTPSLTPNLYALMIRLTATHNGRLHSTQGHLAHAAFLNIVQQVDPALSAALHDKNGRKPFTVSPLQGFGHGHKGRVDIHAGQSGWLRVTLLDPTLFQTFIRYFLEGRRPPTLRLEQMQFAISEILSTNGSHPGLAQPVINFPNIILLENKSDGNGRKRPPKNVEQLMRLAKRGA